MKRRNLILVFSILLFSCNGEQQFVQTSFPYPAINNFVEDYIGESNYNVHELWIEQNAFRTKFYLRDISNACELDLGDESCPFVNNSDSLNQLKSPLDNLKIK